MSRITDPRIKAFTKLPNVGPAAAGDFLLLGINSPDELAQQDPDELFKRLQGLTGSQQDPCVLDTFRAVVHNARTGERKMWWEFTPLRKDATYRNADKP